MRYYLPVMELDDLVATFSEAFGYVLKEDFNGAVNSIKKLKDEEGSCEKNEEGNGNDTDDAKKVMKYISVVLQLIKNEQCAEYFDRFMSASVTGGLINIMDTLKLLREPVHFSADIPFFEVFSSAIYLRSTVRPEWDPSYFELIAESIEDFCERTVHITGMEDQNKDSQNELSRALQYLKQAVSERVFNPAEVEFLTRVYAEKFITSEDYSSAETLLSFVLNLGIKRRNLIEDHMFVYELSKGNHFIEYFQDLFSPHRFLIARNLAFRFKAVNRDDLAQKYNYLAHISQTNNLLIEERIALEEYQRGDASAQEHLAHYIYECGSFNPCIYVAYGKLISRNSKEMPTEALNAFRTALRGYDFAMTQIEFIPNEWILSALEAAELLEDHEKYGAIKKLADERGLGNSEAKPEDKMLI